MKEKRGKKKISGVRTFPVSFALREKKENVINTSSKHSKEQIISQALKFHSEGNIPEAKKYYQYFINQGLTDHRVFSNYGIILKDLGKLKEAEQLYRKAIELKPDFANAHSNLGNILRDLGDLKQAELSTRKAIELKPDFANAHSNLGIILRDLGKLKEAELYTHKAIELNPSFAEAHSNLGKILRDFGNLQQAELSTRKAIKLNPNFADAHSSLGSILRDLGHLQQAELSTRKAIELNPNFAKTHSNLGNILRDLGDLKQAEFSTRKAIELDPSFASAYSNLGTILRDLGKLKEAELSTRKAIKLNPELSEAHSNLGNILRDLGDLKQAELSTRKAIKLNPDFAEAYHNLSLIELQKGNYQSGLEYYEFRFKTKTNDITHGKTTLKRIDHQKGEKGKKLLIISEQGLGDTLQYMRYIPYLRHKGFDTSFSAQTKLHSLIQSSGIDQNPLTPEQASQVLEGNWIPLLSLPRYLKVSPDKPIITEKYIYSTDKLNQKWKNILSQEKRPIIGINWQGNPEMEKIFYRGRSIPIETFSILSDQNEITLLSLQKGYGSDQLNHCSFQTKFVKCQSIINSTWDFLETAAIIMNCDLIITCDTSIAHLAGGLGKPVWLLLRDVPFWTWGLKEESTFWYPSMKLFRQKERHNWYEVMKRVSDELHKKLASKDAFI